MIGHSIALAGPSLQRVPVNYSCSDLVDKALAILFYCPLLILAQFS